MADAAAARAVELLLGGRVTGVETPGDRSAESLRVRLEDRSVIATRRDNSQRGAMEAVALQALAARGAPVPRMLAFDGSWMIQEDVGEQRLSEALFHASRRDGERWLEAAVMSLRAVHDAGRAARLERLLPTLGGGDKWLDELVDIPHRLARLLDVPAPALPVADLTELLKVSRPRFIKWDARPGNAAALADGSVIWFDWEHCGCRNGLDDLAWLLGDEYTPDWPDAELELIERHLAAFDDGEDRAQAEDYLAAFGTLHMCVRLSLIVSRKGDGDWWDWQRCLSGDRVGVTREATLRVCRRAARWAERSPSTAILSPWFESLASVIEGWQ